MIGADGWWSRFGAQACFVGEESKVLVVDDQDNEVSTAVDG